MPVLACSSDLAVDKFAFHKIVVSSDVILEFDEVLLLQNSQDGFVNGFVLRTSNNAQRQQQMLSLLLMILTSDKKKKNGV